MTLVQRLATKAKIEALTDDQVREELADIQDAGSQTDTTDQLEPVPAGSVAAVLEWVGDEPARAIAALEAEKASPHPRTSLVAKLERIGWP